MLLSRNRRNKEDVHSVKSGILRDFKHKQKRHDLKIFDLVPKRGIFWFWLPLMQNCSTFRLYSKLDINLDFKLKFQSARHDPVRVKKMDMQAILENDRRLLLGKSVHPHPHFRVPSYWI